MKLRDIATALSGTLHGNANPDITGIAAFNEAQPGTLTFAFSHDYIRKLTQTPAAAVVTTEPLRGVPIPHIVVQNSRKALAQTIYLFYPEQNQTPTEDLSSQSPIHSTAGVTNSVQIGPFVSIGAHSEIGEETRLMSHVSIGKNCKIGAHCVLYPHVVVQDGCGIGNHVTIFPGTIIGSDGFGYYFDEGNYHKIPHIGSVKIEDYVEIGANACLDRGCLGNTVIGYGSKLDNLVQIAHNTIVGKHCAIAAQCGFSGSCTLEDYVRMGGQVGFADHLTIGPNTTIVGRSGVTKNFPKGNVTLSGFPAQPHEKEQVEKAVLKRLAKDHLNRKNASH